MKAASRPASVPSAACGGSPCCCGDEGLHCGSAVRLGDIGCRDVEYLLDITPVGALLRSHAKLLVIDSSVPLLACFQAMAEYDRGFALVYEPPSHDIIGCFDELLFARLLLSGDYAPLSSPIRDYLKLKSARPVCRVFEDVSALKALPLLLSQSSRRLFVWSSHTSAPLGYLTTGCYLAYILKHLRGSARHVEACIQDVRSTCEYPSVSSDSSLREVLSTLTKHGQVLVASSDGTAVSLLSRATVVLYALSLFRSKATLHLSTPLSEVLKYLDVLPHLRPTLSEAQGDTPLLEALSSVLGSHIGAVLCHDGRAGVSRVISVWDVLQHILYHLL